MSNLYFKRITPIEKALIVIGAPNTKVLDFLSKIIINKYLELSNKEF